MFGGASVCCRGDTSFSSVCVAQASQFPRARQKKHLLRIWIRCLSTNKRTAGSDKPKDGLARKRQVCFLPPDHGQVDSLEMWGISGTLRDQSLFYSTSPHLSSFRSIPFHIGTSRDWRMFHYDTIAPVGRHRLGSVRFECIVTVALEGIGGKVVGLHLAPQGRAPDAQGLGHLGDLSF